MVLDMSKDTPKLERDWLVDVAFAQCRAAKVRAATAAEAVDLVRRGIWSDLIDLPDATYRPLPESVRPAPSKGNA